MIKQILIFLIGLGSVFQSTSQNIEVVSPYEFGTLKNGTAVGKWKFYDSAGRLSISVDYDQNKLSFNKIDTSEFLVETSLGVWEKSRLTNPTRFVGSYARLLEHYMYSIIDLNLKEEVFYQLEFEVDIDGVAKNPKVTWGSNNRVIKKILTAFNSAPNIWIPGSIGTRFVKTKFMIPILKCYKECNSIKGMAHGKIVKEGKIIFPIAIRLMKNLYDSAYKRKSLFFKFKPSQLSWSPNDKYVFLKSNSKDGIYTYFFNTSNLNLEKTLYAPDPYMIFCKTDDCSTLTINYDSKVENDLIYEFADTSGIKIISKNNDIIQTVPSRNGYLLIRRYHNKSNSLIHLKNGIQVDITKFLELDWDQRSQSFILVSDSSLLRLSWEGILSKIEFISFLTQEKKNLIEGDYELVSISNTKSKVLLIELEPRLRVTGKLCVLDLKSGNMTKLTKSFESISNAFWSPDSEYVYFSNERKTFKVSVSNQSLIKVNNIGSPTASHDGKRIVFQEKQKGKLVLYIANIDGSEAEVIHSQTIIYN